MDINSQLIAAPHLGENAVLEVDALWQHSDTVALLFHPNPVDGGAMSNKIVSTLYRHARDKGYDVVRYNSRGVGKSSGTATASLAEFEDALCVLRWLQTQTQAKKIWLSGFSFGGFMACLVADFVGQHSDLSLQKLMLIAPSIERNDVSGLNLDFSKTAMIYGSQDELVSPHIMAKFADDHQIKTQILDAGHFFHGKLSPLKNALIELDGTNQHKMFKE